ncbi:hypothetical protein ACVWWJ_000612 [Luteibacter sp. HA06]
MSTLAAQTGPPRSMRKAATAAHVPIWPTAAPLVRNSPRGWTPRSLTTIRSAGRRANSRSGFALSARPARTSGMGRVFGAHPRGEFPTSGAAVGQIRTWAAVAAFPVRNAKGCLSSEGGHRRLCALRGQAAKALRRDLRTRRGVSWSQAPHPASPKFREEPFFCLAELPGDLPARPGLCPACGPSSSGPHRPPAGTGASSRGRARRMRQLEAPCVTAAPSLQSLRVAGIHDV